VGFFSSLISSAARGIAMDTVFYSWQSDLEAKANRYFIERALEDAVKSLKRDG